MRNRHWILLLAVTVTLLTGVLAFQFKSAPSALTEYKRLTYLVWVGSVLVALWFRVGWRFLDNVISGIPRVTLTACLIALAAMVAVFCGLAGMRQFSGFDHSALIDTPWRIMMGQRPYVDFPCTLPVGCYLSAFYAFKLAGVSWSSLVLLNSFFAMLSFLWVAALLACILGSVPRTWAFALGVQACTTMLVCYWWYNPVTTVMGAVFFLSSVVWLKSQESRYAWLSWGCSLLMFAACKPNIAGPLIVGMVLIMLSEKRLFWRVLATSAAAFSAFLTLLAVHQITLGEMLNGYLAVASRGFSGIQFLQDLDPVEKGFSISFLIIIVLPLLVLGPSLYRIDRLQHMCLWALVCGLYGFATNGESKLVDLPLIFLAVTIWVQEAGAPAVSSLTASKLVKNLQSLQDTVIIALIVCAMSFGWMRHRVRISGLGSFFEYAGLSSIKQVPFFSNLRAAPLFQTTVLEVSEVIREHAGDNFFFGPRMQWAYAAMNQMPPKNEPSWWHPGVAYKAEDESRYLDAWRQARHKVLVFLKNDFTYLSDEFKRELAVNYTEQTRQAILVYIRNKAADPP